MKQWIKLERIPGLLASAYIKATRLVIDSYYRPVAEEIVSNMNKGLILDLGTGPGYLPVEIVKMAPEINIIVQKIRSIVEHTDFKDYQIEDLKEEVRIKMKK